MGAAASTLARVRTAPSSTLAEATWRLREQEHAERVDRLTAGHLARRAAGTKHPVEDFLWTYYSVKPAELRRWHPGAGVALAGAGEERASWRYYARVGAPHGGRNPAVGTDRDAAVDVPALLARRGGTVDYVERLLTATLERTPRYGCFGLHEWAMVYRMSPEQLRHSSLELRIGHAETDRVVEAHPITCTHFDAYRFFTREAAPLNSITPTRDTQPELEQAGCLHAGMDVYKWAAKLGPIIPGELLLDAFVLARDIREVDMRASPYEVSAFKGADGARLTAIPIESAGGKREYARLQRGFTERGNALRERVLAAIAATRALASSERLTQPRTDPLAASPSAAVA